MNILYLSADPGIDLADHSGGSIHIRSLVRALAQLGHAVTVVCSSVGSDGCLAALRADVCPAPLARWNRALARTTQRANRLIGRTGRLHPDLVRSLHNVTFSRTAAAAARGLRPDFIYERYSLWGMAGLRLAQAHSIPLVLEVNAPLADEQQRYRGLTFPWLARWIEGRVWRGADVIVAVSEPLRRRLESVGVRPERVRILPNAVDTDLFRPDVDGAQVRRRCDLDGRFVVGFAGTFKAWHGVDILLAAFRGLRQTDPSIHLLLVGDGPLRPALEEMVRTTGLEEAVTFAGRVTHDAMPAYLAAMDIAVVPYPALDEFYFSPLKLFEYMAAGRAVVASRVGQVVDLIVDGETGLLFEPGDDTGLVDRVQRLRQDATLRRELGRAASSLVRSAYTWRHNADRVVGWVEPLLAHRAVVMST